jgi:hypothetical protein
MVAIADALSGAGKAVVSRNGRVSGQRVFEASGAVVSIMTRNGRDSGRRLRDEAGPKAKNPLGETTPKGGPAAYTSEMKRPNWALMGPGP